MGFASVYVCWTSFGLCLTSELLCPTTTSAVQTDWKKTSQNPRVILGLTEIQTADTLPMVPHRMETQFFSCQLQGTQPHLQICRWWVRSNDEYRKYIYIFCMKLKEGFLSAWDWDSGWGKK